MRRRDGGAGRQATQPHRRRSPGLDRILFEVISAAATGGLSTGVTEALTPSGQLLITALMFTGRVGTVTLATALALREQKVPFRYPEERPIIG